jgi:spore germination protein
MNKIIWVLQILLVLGLSFSAYYLYSNRQTQFVTEYRTVVFERSNKSVIEFEEEQLAKVDYSTPSNIEVGGWIPDWDMVDGLKSVESQEGLDYISPVWFILGEEERLKANSYANGPGIMEQVEERGLSLVPAILQLNVDNLSRHLKDQKAIDKHIDNILGWVDEFDYDGIDLDYEVIYLKDKKNFYSFLKQLSDELHSRGKILAMAVLPIWYGSESSTSSPQTRKVQDYSEIAEYLDEVRLMTYELFYSGSQVAGPIAPINWMEATIRYAIATGIPRNKIVLGIPTYSYDWTDRDLAGDKIEYNNMGQAYYRPTNLENGVPLFNVSIEKIKIEYEYTEEYNEVWEDMVLKYKFNDTDRVVVYPNQRSLDARKAMAVKYGLKGVAYWRLGDEGSLIL